MQRGTQSGKNKLESEREREREREKVPEIKSEQIRQKNFFRNQAEKN